jgi:hypothetical protein
MRTQALFLLYGIGQLFNSALAGMKRITAISIIEIIVVLSLGRTIDPTISPEEVVVRIAVRPLITLSQNRTGHARA